MSDDQSTRDLWRKLEDTRAEVHGLDNRTGKLEDRLAANEEHNVSLQAAIETLTEEVRCFRSELRTGKTVLKTLIKVGAVAGAVLSFLAWLWVELKKLGN